MKHIWIEKYDDLRLCQVETDELFEITPMESTHIRVKTPAAEVFQLAMQEQNFFHADRMVRASINLRRLPSDIEKRIRHTVICTEEYKKEAVEIARKSFSVDRRFHVNVRLDSRIADKVIAGWLDSISDCYICKYKDHAAGFAVLKDHGEGIYEIHLAAVDECYRMSGAAVSLYAALAKICQELGGRILYGWISTVNMPVMNLYASLGAAFSEPSDIFLKEIRG